MNENTSGGSLGVQLGNEQIELIKRTIAKGASDEELSLFIAQCKRTGLDPFARQIYSVPRQERGRDGKYITRHVTQVSIDGLRLIAERSNKYQGQVGPFWCGEDGVWKEVWLAKLPPMAAKVGVIRSDFKEPLYAVARYDTYVQLKDGVPTFFWKKMPDLMLGKTAESLAMRRAFPQELSGLYIPEEMVDTLEYEPPKEIRRSKTEALANHLTAEVFPVVEEDEATKAIPHATDDQKKKIVQWYGQHGVSLIDLEKYVGCSHQTWTTVDTDSMSNVAKISLAKSKETGESLAEILRGAII